MSVKAIILGAGEGNRLRPYTLDRPKCMVELAGKPLLTHIIDAFAAAGIDDVYVVTGYRADIIDRLGVPTFHNPNFASTNMVVSLMQAADVLTSGADVLVSYADIIFEPRVVEALLGCDAPVSIAINTAWRELWELRMENPLADAETLKLDAHGDVRELGKKPESYAEIEGQYMGLIKFRAEQAAMVPQVFHRLDSEATYDGKDKPNMYMTSFLQNWVDHQTPIRAVPVGGGWIEVDTSEELELYTRLHRDGQLASLIRI